MAMAPSALGSRGQWTLFQRRSEENPRLRGSHETAPAEEAAGEDHEHVLVLLLKTLHLAISIRQRSWHRSSGRESGSDSGSGVRGRGCQLNLNCRENQAELQDCSF